MKNNCRRQSLQKVKYDVLKPRNFSYFWSAIVDWRSQGKKLGKRTQDLYNKMTSRIPLAEFCLQGSSIPLDTPSPDKILVFASTKNGIEGILRLVKAGDGFMTSVNFIGNAPWNIRTESASPKFFGISEDLMRISLLVSLHLASGAKDDSIIYFVSFVTKRGINFARRFFNIQGIMPQTHPVTVEINKTGVESFLRDDFESFRANCRIRGRFPLEIGPFDTP